MHTDPAALTLQQRIERARAATAARAVQSGAPPVEATAPASAQVATQPAARAASRPPVEGVPTTAMTPQQRLMWDIVRAAQLAGARDLTGGEIWERWCRQSGHTQRNTSVAGRLAELKRAGWLLERPEMRICANSQHLAKAVYVPECLLNAAPSRGGR